MMNIPAGLAFAVLLAVGGCSSDKVDPTTPPAQRPSVSNETSVNEVPAAGETIGAKGSACEMPLSFQTAADWKAEPIDPKQLGELADLAKVGDFTVVCEVDAKPAGNIGFLRVHVAEGLSGTPAERLQEFVKAAVGKKEAANTEITDVRIGAVQAAEASWETLDKEYDIRSKYAAFAINTKGGMVVVHLSPLDDGEFTGMQPAYELAKKTVKIDV
jgi:Uncharacterised lipoprotein